MVSSAFLLEFPFSLIRMYYENYDKVRSNPCYDDKGCTRVYPKYRVIRSVLGAVFFTIGDITLGEKSVKQILLHKKGIFVLDLE